ncbi:Hpt domain-containing protein [bacterium]|nr:Hpt domain-containing protein [bacterium]
MLDSLSMDHPALAPVQGLNSQEALARLGGNLPVYLKMLRRFLELESLPAQIAQELSLGQGAVAQRLAHTLKGVAASLGADSLQQQALQLEQCLGQGSDPSPILAEVRHQLTALVQAIRMALPPEPEANLSGPDLQQVAPLGGKMAAWLESFDSQACELLEAEPMAFRMLLGSHFLEFEKAVTGYAFDEALQVLRQAASKSGVPLT